MFENVVVGADDSTAATGAMRKAIEVTKASGGVLHIVTAFKARRPSPPPLPDEFRYSFGSLDPVDVLLRELEAMAHAESVRVATHAVLAGPVEAITLVADQEKADLIVVGNKTRHGPRHLGSVPDGLIEKATCAVLVV
jgi:nucleotide-binding universal stress UspA family protein